MTPLLLIQPLGHNPDALISVVQNLPAGSPPKLINTTGLSFDDAVREYEKYLDKHEIRHVDIVGHGTGAAIAIKLTDRNPSRVRRLIVSAPEVYVDEKQTHAQLTALKFMPSFLLKGQKKSMQSALESNLGLDVREEARKLSSRMLVLAGEEHRSTFPQAEFKNVSLSTPQEFAATIACG